MKHVPTPYYVEPNGGAYVKDPEFATTRITAEDPDLAVALVLSDCRRLREEFSGTAEFIVRACNSHDALLASVARFLAVWDAYMADDGSVNPHDHLRGDEIDAMRDAHAKATATI